jgi:hypothetical protein
MRSQMPLSHLWSVEREDADARAVTGRGAPPDPDKLIWTGDAPHPCPLATCCSSPVMLSSKGVSG